MWSPDSRSPARPPAILSKAPEISVPSACGNVVWRKVAQRPRAPAPPPPGPPPPALSPSPSPPAPPAAPLLGRGVLPLTRRRSKLGAASRAFWEETWGDWEWRQTSQSRCWSPGAARASGFPRAGERAVRVWRVLLRCKENLPQCLEQGLQRGWRRRTP